MTITTPGFYHDMSEKDYHADPAPVPSLSSSCAKTLIGRSPLHAYSEHPRLGAIPKDDTAEMEFGELAHKLLLGKGAEIALCPNDTWRGKESAEFWDAAKKAGKIPALQKTLDRANKMADSVREQMVGLGLEHVFSPTQGKSEVTAFWKEGNSWMRSMMDKVFIEQGMIYDLKTMSQSAHPRACAARIANMGYDIQQAHYVRGLEVLRPDLVGRVTFIFIFVETVYPFAVTPVQLDGEWKAIGKSKWERALAKWQECTVSNNWPGYAQDTLRLEAPNWALSQEMDAE